MMQMFQVTMSSPRHLQSATAMSPQAIAAQIPSQLGLQHPQLLVPQTTSMLSQSQHTLLTSFTPPLRKKLDSLPSNYTSARLAAQPFKLLSGMLSICPLAGRRLNIFSYGTTIHLVRATCSICHGTSSSTTINLDGTEHSHFRAAATPTSTPQRPTIHRSPNTKNRVAKQKHKRNRSLNHHSTVDRGGLFYCQSEGCNRSPGGRSFARKDNRDVHERTVHGVETGEDHEAD